MSGHQTSGGRQCLCVAAVKDQEDGRFSGIEGDKAIGLSIGGRPSRFS
jgi:hypothetical protein